MVVIIVISGQSIYVLRDYFNLNLSDGISAFATMILKIKY